MLARFRNQEECGGCHMKLKKNELVLLSYFRQNARQALTKISRSTGMPVSTIFDRLRKYEGDVILRHTSLLNFQKLGYTTRAQVFLRTTPDNRDVLGGFLKAYPNVNGVYRVNNGYDYHIEVIFRSIQELEAFLELLEIERGVTDKNVYYVINEVARESFMMAPELVAE